MRRRQKKRQLSCYNNQWLPGKVFFKLGRVAKQKLLGRVLHVSLTWAPASKHSDVDSWARPAGKRFILPLFQHLVWQTLIFLNKNDGFHCSAAQNGKFNYQNHDSILCFVSLYYSMKSLWFYDFNPKSCFSWTTVTRQVKHNFWMDCPWSYSRKEICCYRESDVQLLYIRESRAVECTTNHEENTTTAARTNIIQHHHQH